MERSATNKRQSSWIGSWLGFLKPVAWPPTPARGHAPGHSLLNDSGAAIIEFALSASLLLMLLFGIIQVCLALYVFNYVSDASREAARYAIVRGSSCSGMPDCGATQTTIQTYVRGFNYPGIDASEVNITVTWLSASSTQPTTWTVCATQCNAPGNAVRVQTTYNLPLNIPFLKDYTANLSSTSQMVISN